MNQNEKTKWNLVAYSYTTNKKLVAKKRDEFIKRGVPETQIFIDTYRNENGSRSAFDKSLKYLRPGDRLIVSSLNDISWTAEFMLKIISELVEDRKIEVELLSPLPGEFLILFSNDREKEGIPKAAEMISIMRKQLHKSLPENRMTNHSGLGRPPVLSELDWAEACILAQSGKSGRQIALRFTHVSRATIFRYLNAFRANRSYPFVAKPNFTNPITKKDWSYL